jgi:hypothetical protein
MHNVEPAVFHLKHLRVAQLVARHSHVHHLDRTLF